MTIGHLAETGSLQNEVSSALHKPTKGAFACMINSEIGAILAVMRRNVRWGVQYMADDDQLEHSLIHSLKELRKQVFTWQQEWHQIDPAIYLSPFLNVIRSMETGAPITGVALSSVYKILTLDVLSVNTVNVGEAMRLIVDAVTSCKFEVTDPASEEVVLMKILQVLLACMKSKASSKLSNQRVINIINTCFRVVHEASSKGELLQRISRHTMHELVRCIFSRLPSLKIEKLDNGSSSVGTEELEECSFGGAQAENGPMRGGNDGPTSTSDSSSDLTSGLRHAKDLNDFVITSEVEAKSNTEKDMAEPFGAGCMVDIFQFLCSLLNVVEHIEIGPRSNPVAYDEDVPLFALGLINSAIELGGPSFREHPELLSSIQDDLFCNLTQYGLSMSPLILSTVCSIVLNLYHHLRAELKVQLEAFFSCVLLRVAQGKHGSSYQLQEVAMEALVDLCRQPTFMTEMYANFDCDIACSNVFEDIANLLSKSSFPVNGPLSAMHVVALDGMTSMIQGIADRLGSDMSVSEVAATEDDKRFKAFWTIKCENFADPNVWIPFVQKMRNIKQRLMVGANQFNQNPKKGLDFLQQTYLLPDKLDPQSVASLFRYTSCLDKTLIGDFLGNHDEFCIHVLHEFARTFDFEGMNLDTALRLFLGTFRLPGESQKIQRVLEAFAERYYEQSPDILANKDAALLLSYSLIMLNTDQHNVQVKKKMTKEDFVRNNRHINDGKDLPREYLLELYGSICENEIQLIPEQVAGFPLMTAGCWVNVVHKSKIVNPFIVCDSGTLLDHDMFAILSRPTVAALSVVFDQSDQEEVLQMCINGFLAIAKISAHYHLLELLDDLIVSLCKFTGLLTPLFLADEAILALAEDTKSRMAITTIFTVANRYGDYIRMGWKIIFECVLILHQLDLLPAGLASDTADDLEPSSDLQRVKSAPSSLSSLIPSSGIIPRKSSGFMGRFTQLLSFDIEEPKSLPTEEQLRAHRLTREAIQSCHIDMIFLESKFLQAESLLHLVQSIILVASRLSREASFSMEDEVGPVFCLDLLIAITLNNRDRIMLIWQVVYEHIAAIVQSTIMPCTLVEKAVFGLLRICQRLLPYKENLTDELLKSLQLILKLDARVADTYCDNITNEVKRMVKSSAIHIRSHLGWRTIISLLSITARHPEASEAGFETLSFIMSDGSHLLPCNYILCVDAARQFAESRLGDGAQRSISALDMMMGSVVSLARWSSEAKNAAVGEEAAVKLREDIGEMWLRMVQAIRKLCLDQRDEVRNRAILMLQGSVAGVDGINQFPIAKLFQFFDLVIFTLLDELLEIALESFPKDYKEIEVTLVLAMKAMTKAFLQQLQDLSQQPSFCRLWLGVLNRMERYLKAKFRGKRSEKIHELVPELLKNILLVMKTTGVLLPNSDDIAGDSFWQLTWLHVKNVCPSLHSELYPDDEMEANQKVSEGVPAGDQAVIVQSTASLT
ncbi:unnamed protein product [Linum tenue]|uniref:SEC7 domain-containing protein n=1 Tax=Linum tenue TaxID=586396 RepID=A0AAV0RVF7_9ROSI|nr:unnamed protein product [Linum tenue]